jgi:putative endonuclease
MGCIMTNRRDGTLYAGVTRNLARRIYEHRTGATPRFTKHYGLTRLVYAEQYEEIGAAIQREKQIKHIPLAEKVRLIHSLNPDWKDLYDDLH